MRTRGAGTRDAVVGGQGPLALSPRLAVSPSPSCPLLLLPQHLTLASSCGEEQPRSLTGSGLTDWEESWESYSHMHVARL